MTATIVRCEDGQVRHAEPHDDVAGARRWAHWGHPCTTQHTYEAAEPDVEQIGVPGHVIVVLDHGAGGDPRFVVTCSCGDLDAVAGRSAFAILTVVALHKEGL